MDRHVCVLATATAPQRFERTVGDTCAPLPRGYRPRDPRRTVLYRVAQQHVATMFEQVADATGGTGLPRHVRAEFERFLRCGIAAHGFARVFCTACRYTLIVPFSCKGRGVCTSCTARRMHDRAAFLTDRVLPDAPYRQWTWSLPRPVRFRLARDSRLIAEAVRALVREVRRFQRRRARARTWRDAEIGAVTFVQRFASDVTLNVHLHSLVADGVWYRGEDGQVRFGELPAPDDADVARIGRLAAERLMRRLAVRRITFGPDADDVEDDDALAALQAESIDAGRGCDTRRPLEEPQRTKPLCSRWYDFSLHAGTTVHPNDREGLDYLCRYGSRGPVAEQRLSLADNGDVLLHLRRRGRGGRSEIRFDPVTFLRRLATLVPPPRSNLVRFSGVFAPNARWREQVVPEVPPARFASVPARPPRGERKDEHRLPWAELLARTWETDVRTCPRCHGPLRVVAYLTEPDTVRRVLEHLGLATDTPRASPARGPPEPSFTWAHDEPTDLDELPSYNPDT